MHLATPRSAAFFIRLLVLGLLCIFSGPNQAAAQSLIISGVVRDSLTQAPLPYASVFLAGTTRGTSTDDAGRFSIKGVTTGHYEFVVSYLGYNLYKRDLHVQSSQTLNPLLTPTANKLQEVVVRPAVKPEDYQNFARLFVGSTSFSGQCRILNPKEVVAYYDAKGRELVASAPALQIENRALGYRLTYHRLQFSMNYASGTLTYLGTPVFEEMQPRGAAQQRRWAANRRRAYLGSLQHFLRSVHANRVSEAGFLVQRVRIVPNVRRVRADSLFQVLVREARSRQQPLVLHDSLITRRQEPRNFKQLYTRPLPGDSLRQVRPETGQVWLRFRDIIQVSYQREKPDPAYAASLGMLASPAARAAAAKEQVSTLHLLQRAAELQATGLLVDPLAVFNEGYWSFEKIGEFLPADYVPE